MPSGNPNGRMGPTVGTIARLHPEKGIEFLLDAAPQIAAAVPDVRFVLVGEGPLRDDLEARAQRVGVADRVAFVGPRDDARRLISSFDVLALPSISEGTPLTIVEAMLAGVPVVASAVGGIPEQIEDRETGFLVGPADADALAQAVTQALTDETLRHSVTRLARARAETEFSHEDLIERTAAVYATAANQPTPAAASPRPRVGRPAVGPARARSRHGFLPIAWIARDPSRSDRIERSATKSSTPPIPAVAAENLHRGKPRPCASRRRRSRRRNRRKPLL
jgi:hypothetical protein